MNFYSQITPFSNFNDLSNDKFYVPAPQDWIVLITDIGGSTQAIKEGRYKDVNMIGAASIVCVRKALQSQEFAYAFGGDGSTFLIPAEQSQVAIDALNSLKDFAQKSFDLKLRVGAVTVSELVKNQNRVEVARFSISKDQSIATFRGDGFTIAEKWIKSMPERYETRAKNKTEADLSGLSCRWKPIQNHRGTILSLIVKSRMEGFDLYSSILKAFEKILPEGLEAHNPTLSPKKEYRSLRDSVSGDKKIFPLGFKNKVEWLSELAFAQLMFRTGLIKFFPKVQNYRNDIPSHSDYKKFDDVLRMTIDCSKEQAKEILSYLQSLYEQKQIFYGTFESSTALMTCFVETIDPGNHIHFIDGNNGGYAQAAVQLKSQIANSISN
jgi:hypothetical protein